MQYLLFVIVIILIIITVYFFFQQKQFKDEKIILQNKNDELNSRLSEYLEENATLKERNNNQQQQINDLKSKLEQKENEVHQLTIDIASKKEKITHLEKMLSEQKQELQNIQSQLKTEFENITNKILEQNTKKLTEQNEQILSNVIRPFKDSIGQIKEIEQKIQNYYDNENKERASLKTNIENLIQQSNEVKQTAEKLANALTTQVKYQGNWGEFILEKLLELSGLQENIHYTAQHKNDDKQPDITINLPNDKYIIIDSKVTLNSFVEYQSATTEADKIKYAQDIIKSIEQHIDNLSKKEYEKIYSINSVDFVLMFIPIEAIIYILNQYKPEIFNAAIRKRILLVSPASLLATLKTIYFVWQQEKQRKEFEDILDAIHKLHDKLRIFTEHFSKIKDRLNDALNACEDAEKSLTTGKGNALSIIKNKIEPYIHPKSNITKLLPTEDNNIEDTNEK